MGAWLDLCGPEARPCKLAPTIDGDEIRLSMLHLPRFLAKGDRIGKYSLYFLKYHFDRLLRPFGKYSDQQENTALAKY